MEEYHNKIMTSSDPQIVFFDLETTVPNRSAGRFHVLEFGAMVVCPRKLVELESYTTLIRPRDLTVVSLRSCRTDGITRAAVASAPTFEEVADTIFGILNGRIWAGHNIHRFDMVRIKEAFAEIGRPAPLPLGSIDSLGVLTQRFGRRAGNMKMATLATYFGLGHQKHRSLDDVRMNLEVLKHCATVLFLESSLPAGLLRNGNGEDQWQQQHQYHKGCSKMVTRSRSTSTSNYIAKNRKSPPTATATATSLISYQRPLPYATRSFGIKMMQMTQGVNNLLCRAQETRSITRLLKHSQSFLR
ncbi:Protein NEN4 [Linum perenne]